VRAVQVWPVGVGAIVAEVAVKVVAIVQPRRFAPDERENPNEEHTSPEDDQDQQAQAVRASAILLQLKGRPLHPRTIISAHHPRIRFCYFRANSRSVSQIHRAADRESRGPTVSAEPPFWAALPCASVISSAVASSSFELDPPILARSLPEAGDPVCRVRFVAAVVSRPISGIPGI